MQQNPPHCQAAPNAAAVAQQGPHVGESYTVGCARRTRGRLRRQQLPEICGARLLPQSSCLQEASGSSRGRVRIH